MLPTLLAPGRSEEPLPTATGYLGDQPCTDTGGNGGNDGMSSQKRHMGQRCNKVEVTSCAHSQSPPCGPQDHRDSLTDGMIAEW